MNWLIAVTTDTTWLDYLSRVGVVGILLASHWGFHKRWWVWGHEFVDLDERHVHLRERCQKLEDDRDAWKEQALTGGRVAASATSIAAAAIERGLQQQPGR